MLVIVNVGLSKMLMFRVLMRRVGMSDRQMVMQMSVSSRQVLPFAEDLVKPLSAIVGYMIVLVFMSQNLVAVLDKWKNMGSLPRFLGEASGCERAPQNRPDRYNSPTDQRDQSKESFHNLPLPYGVAIPRINQPMPHRKSSGLKATT